MAKRTVNKTAFILSLPKDMPAAEAVAAAKKKGIKIGEKYVYNIRAKAKSNGEVKKGKPGRPPSKVNGSKRATFAAGGDESRFVDMAIDMGLGRAEELLRRARTAVASVLG